MGEIKDIWIVSSREIVNIFGLEPSVHDEQGRLSFRLGNTEVFGLVPRSTYFAVEAYDWKNGQKLPVNKFSSIDVIEATKYVSNVEVQQLLENQQNIKMLGLIS